MRGGECGVLYIIYTGSCCIVVVEGDSVEINYDVLTKQEVVNELNRYLEIQNVLYEHIKIFKEGDKIDREISRIKLREVYGSFKNEMQGHYNALNSSRISRNSVADAYFSPAIQDIHVHISGVGVNRITRQGMAAFYSAVYDIGSYARYHLPKG
jgi:hypothetical protein